MTQRNADTRIVNGVPLGRLQSGAEPTMDAAGNLVTEDGTVPVKKKPAPSEEKK